VPIEEEEVKQTFKIQTSCDMKLFRWASSFRRVKGRGAIILEGQ
jgi:hypothetical protein